MGIDLHINAQGDLQVDAHHTVEDVGITLGQAVAEAAGDKRGIFRYGHVYVPLDEALSRVVIDFSGRPGLTYGVNFTRPRVGDFDVDLLREFFQGFANHAQTTLHIDNLKGVNAHHQAETIFKAFGRALRMALERDPRTADAPSTKGAVALLLIPAIDLKGGQCVQLRQGAMASASIYSDDPQVSPSAGTGPGHAACKWWT